LIFKIHNIEQNNKNIMNLQLEVSKKVRKNFQKRYESLPESLIKPKMVYINICINGTIIRAFVDTGASISIMCRSMALICGIDDLIDCRCVGKAIGIGKKDITGTIHYVDVQFGNSLCSCTFSILDESDILLIIGMDILRRYNAILDFSKNELRIGGEIIKFID